MMPTFSWPRTISPSMPFCQLWRSVPQMPASSWRNSTLPGSGSRTGYSRISKSCPWAMTARAVVAIRCLLLLAVCALFEMPVLSAAVLVIYLGVRSRACCVAKCYVELQDSSLTDSCPFKSCQVGRVLFFLNFNGRVRSLESRVSWIACGSRSGGPGRSFRDASLPGRATTGCVIDFTRRALCSHSLVAVAGVCCRKM